MTPLRPTGSSLWPQRLTVIAFALTFYCLGTTYFEAFVNYRTWALIGPQDFAAYHRGLTPLVVNVMLLPLAVYVASLMALLATGAATIPRWALVTSLALVLAAVASSIFIQIPIQRTFDRAGMSLPLLQRLIRTDLLFRKLPLGMNALLWVAMFGRHRVGRGGLVRVP